MKVPHILKSRPVLTGIVLAFAVLVLVYFVYGPVLVKRYVNHVLQERPDYRGEVAKIDIHLWRGAYQIHSLKLEKRSGKQFVPYITAETIDFSMEWKALFQGAVVGEVVLFRPQLNLVDSSDPSKKQLTIDKAWSGQFEKLFPFELNRFEVKDGTLTFRNPTSKPPVDLRATDLQAVGYNLTNVARSKEKMMATVDLRARVLKDGDIVANIKLDPMARYPTFALKTELTKVSIVQMNDFLRAYGNFDAEKGSFELYLESTAEDGNIKGYAKPIFRDLVIFRIDEKFDDPFQAFWEGLVATGAFLVTNSSKETVATRIPFAGRFDGPETDVFAVVLGLIENAYFKEIKPHLDGSPGRGPSELKKK